MKLTYRDRIILLVVIVLAILAIGFFALIKPRINDIKDNDAKLSAVKTEWEGIEAEINKIPGLQDKIMEVYDDSIELCADFEPGMEQGFELDQYMQKYVDECNVIIDKMEASNVSEKTLDFYYLETELVKGSMFESADLNGGYQAGYEKENKTDLALSERTEESVPAQQYGIQVRGSKSEIWKFMQRIADIDKAVIIKEVDIVDYYFGMDPNEERELTWSNPDENGVSVPTNALNEDEGYSICTFVVDLYYVYAPDKPDID